MTQFALLIGNLIFCIGTFMIFRSVKDRHNSVDLSRHTLCHLVVFESKADFVLVFPIKQVHVKIDRVSIDDVLRQLQKFLKKFGSHAAANRIVPFDFGEALAADQEVTSDHIDITVPTLQVFHVFVLHLSEGERKCGVSHFGLVRDAKRLLDHILLVLKNSHD